MAKESQKKAIRTNRSMSDFVASVRQKLDEKSMSIHQLAVKAGVSRPYVHRVLSGEQSPTIEWMEKVARVLGISIQITVK
jgi:DNA-binding phage protein